MRGSVSRPFGKAAGLIMRMGLMRDSSLKVRTMLFVGSENECHVVSARPVLGDERDAVPTVLIPEGAREDVVKVQLTVVRRWGDDCEQQQQQQSESEHEWQKRGTVVVAAAAPLRPTFAAAQFQGVPKERSEVYEMRHDKRERSRDSSETTHHRGR